MKEIEVNGTEISISADTKKDLEEKQKEYFPELDIVGWCLIETGHPMSLNRGANKIHGKMFAKENSVFIWKDSAENDEMFFSYKYGELMQMGGHYIYYERNPAMQNYMISTRRQNGVTPSEMVEDRAAKNFRSAVREKAEYREQRQSSRLLYVTSVLLVIVVLAIGVGAMNNYDKMESVQNSLESLSRSVNKTENGEAMVPEEKSGDYSTDLEQDGINTEENVEDEEALDPNMPEASDTLQQLDDEDYYVVKKGDTLDSISIQMYGDRSYVEAICKMNGLANGNLIFIGQKLLLP